MNGKGDKQRPKAVTGKEYRDNHERIWGGEEMGKPKSTWPDGDGIIGGGTKKDTSI